MLMSEQPDSELETEERAIYAIIAIAACPVVIGFLIGGGVIDGGGTVSMLLVAIGVVGFVASFGVIRRARLARARVHHTRS